MCKSLDCRKPTVRTTQVYMEIQYKKQMTALVRQKPDTKSVCKRVSLTVIKVLKVRATRLKLHPALNWCRPVGLEQDDMFWPGSQPACKVVQRYASSPLGCWLARLIVVCDIRNVPTIASWCSVNESNRQISSSPTINSCLFGLKTCRYPSSSPPIALPCSCESRNTGWGTDGGIEGGPEKESVGLLRRQRGN